MEKENAIEAYNLVCEALDEIGYTYDKDEDGYTISLGIRGDDLVIGLIIMIDEKRELIKMYSPIPVEVNSDKVGELIEAIAYANYNIALGKFVIDLDKNELEYRIVNSFRDCLLGRRAVIDMISVACDTTDDYNDRFKAINDGEMTLEEFKAKADE